MGLGLSFKRAPHMVKKKKKEKNIRTLYLPHRCVRPYPSIHISTRTESTDSPPARLVSCEHHESKAAAAAAHARRRWLRLRALASRQAAMAPAARRIWGERLRARPIRDEWRLRQRGASEASGCSSGGPAHGGYVTTKLLYVLKIHGSHDKITIL